MRLDEEAALQLLKSKLGAADFEEQDEFLKGWNAAIFEEARERHALGEDGPNGMGLGALGDGADDAGPAWAQDSLEEGSE
jgi:hypothetical protein